ncbi:MAG: hypothetical protein ACLQSR_06980 [Limisphaerales bacterium]
MKTSLLVLLAFTLTLCGCATNPVLSPKEANLQISIHVPEGMTGQLITTYLNGFKTSVSTDLTEQMMISQGETKVRVEMAGAKPFEQTIYRGDANGSKQFLDVTLVKE